MGSVGPAEILVILVAALLILGPTKLPEAARQVGRAVAEFRRVTSGFQAEVRDVFSDTPSYNPPAYEPPPVETAALPPATPADAEVDPGPPEDSTDRL